MKKITKSLLFVGASSMVMMTAAEAALLSTATLNFDAPVYLDGVVVSGSNFGIDFNNNGSIELIERTGITSNDGLTLGTAQPGSITNPGIDQPWLFFGIEGIHKTTSPITILSDDGAGNVELDFSGLSVSWNGNEVGLGGSAWGSNSDGVAQLTCSTDCSDGDAFSLFYTATVTEGAFIGVRYRLGFDSGAPILAALAVDDTGSAEDLGVTATGTISAVPVPAAVWLFGSGLIGLAGLARRKKA